MRKTALYAALTAAFTPVFAQELDPEVAALVKPDSELSVGFGRWTKDRPRLGTYDGMNQEGNYWLLDGRLNTRDDRTGTWFILDARNLGLDTRSVRADWLRQGNIGFFVEYDRIVRDEPYTVYSAAQGIGSTIQRVPTTSATALSEYHLGTVREVLGAGFTKVLGGGYDLRVAFKSEDKTGDRLWGRGGAAEFAAEPINSTTRQLEAVLAYVSKAFQVQGGYYGSWYTNHNQLVDTANATAAGVLSNQYFLSLPLDNQAHQVFANGGYNFGERTRATFKVAYTRAVQDEPIPVGTGIIPIATAPKQLDGRLENTLLQVGLTSRTTNAFSWLASLRYYESDEKTPEYRVIQTATPCAIPPASQTCVNSTPLDFETLAGKLEGTYRFSQGMSVIGGLEHAKQDRSVPFGHPGTGGVDAQRYVPFRAKLDETTVRLEARRSLAETLNGRIAYLHSSRDGSDFTRAAANAPQADLINPIHISDRERDKVKLMLDWRVVEPLTLTFNAEHAQDKYGTSPARPYGLREGTNSVISLDAAYAIGERWQLSAWYTRDQSEANQLGQRNAGNNAGEAVKEANLEDIGDTFGAGLRGVLSPAVRVGFDFLASKTVNKYPETITLTSGTGLYPSSGGPPPVAAVGPLPTITNKMTRVNLHLVYAAEKNAEWRFDYVFDRWETDDWSWMFANGTPFTYGGTSDGTQVVQSPKQSANFLGVRYIYKFQ